MAYHRHGRNTMKLDSQDLQGRSLMLHTNRIACMSNQSINEYGAIVLGPMTETRNHDGQDWRVYMPFPVTVPIKAGSK